MDGETKRQLSFPLRLPSSLRESANEFAKKDGVSLNHFISVALAEKISRMEQSSKLEHNAEVNAVTKHAKIVLAN